MINCLYTLKTPYSKVQFLNYARKQRNIYKFNSLCRLYRYYRTHIHHHSVKNKSNQLCISSLSSMAELHPHNRLITSHRNLSCFNCMSTGYHFPPPPPHYHRARPLIFLFYILLYFLIFSVVFIFLFLFVILYLLVKTNSARIRLQSA